MAKNNILSRLGQIVAGLSNKQPQRPEPSHQVLEGSDAPDNARAITAALARMGDKEDAPSRQPVVSQQVKAASAEGSAQNKRSWIGGVAKDYKEKAQEARAAIGRAGSGVRPSRAEGVKETAGLSTAQREARLKAEKMPVNQRTTATGKETRGAALARVEGRLLVLREKENQALAATSGRLAVFGASVGKASGIGKTLLKLDLAFRGSAEVMEQWTDGLMQSKENLREYNGVIANGLAVMEAAEMNRQVERGMSTQNANASFMRQKKGYQDAVAPMKNDFENLKTRAATVGMWFMKWGARVLYHISPITYISKGVEAIADWFGFGAEEEEAPAQLYMEFVEQIADGKFEGPHTKRPAAK